MYKTKSLLGNGSRKLHHYLQGKSQANGTVPSSHRGRVAKGWHRHWPVSTSQVESGRLPKGLQLQAESTEYTITHFYFPMFVNVLNSSHGAKHMATRAQSSQACPAYCLPGCVITVWCAALHGKVSARHLGSPHADPLGGP